MAKISYYKTKGQGVAYSRDITPLYLYWLEYEHYKMIDSSDIMESVTKEKAIKLIKKCLSNQATQEEANYASDYVFKHPLGQIVYSKLSDIEKESFRLNLIEYEKLPTEYILDIISSLNNQENITPFDQYTIIRLEGIYTHRQNKEKIQEASKISKENMRTRIEADEITLK